MKVRKKCNHYYDFSVMLLLIIFLLSAIFYYYLVSSTNTDVVVQTNKNETNILIFNNVMRRTAKDYNYLLFVLGVVDGIDQLKKQLLLDVETTSHKKVYIFFTNYSFSLDYGSFYFSKKL